MSSYMVEEKTIHRIITFLRNLHLEGLSTYFSEIKRELDEMGYTGEDWESDLGTDLLSLNRQAVNDRYDQKKGLGKKYRFHPLKASIFQVLKSARCLSYQMSEGDIPGRRLYKFLETFIDVLEYYIIDKLPEYDKAEWG